MLVPFVEPPGDLALARAVAIDGSVDGYEHLDVPRARRLLEGFGDGLHRDHGRDEVFRPHDAGPQQLDRAGDILRQVGRAALDADLPVLDELQWQPDLPARDPDDDDRAA